MKRSRFGNIQKLPSGRYRARFKLRGEWINAPQTFPLKTPAELWLAQQQTAIALGIWVDPRVAKAEAEAKAIKKRKGGKLFKDWADEYLEKLKKEGRSPNTTRSYASKINHWIIPTFGDTPLDEITREKVREFFDGLPEMNQTTRKNLFLTFSSYMAGAVDAELIEDNPVKIKGATRKNPTPTKHTVLTPSQVADLASLMPDKLQITIWLAAYAGLRFGEIVGLQRQDIDLENRLIHVERSIKRGENGAHIVGPPKSAAGYRTLAISDTLAERLKQHLAKFTLSAPTSWVVSALTDGFAPLSNKTLHSRFNPAAKAIGLEGLRFHDLRHTHLTWLGRAGATNAELMHRAGHSNVDTVMIYQHADQARDAALAAALDRG
ncbi:MAG: site-specific integrase [Mobiluncus sp.]|uniref:tyrosine-type recombinase/integrase n=1 Tax=Mobiluncus sp. TaxID=47293 RepID=UPI0025830144|nr:site-specific integrase [Mobiluncus sp.]MCI6583444.1 site-specific integrase [Mobiluncus sp.]